MEQARRQEVSLLRQLWNLVSGSQPRNPIRKGSDQMNDSIFIYFVSRKSTSKNPKNHHHQFSTRNKIYFGSSAVAMG
jgi:hypothetical protein